mmetsp:Transcript_15446/g.46663  ORF Transcript_15446/g.46663 Transcript_15446/m.46663 type:complete len:249 (-) Transcript_15446:2226-2972(-)
MPRIIQAAYWVVRRDGLMYVTATDGLASGGRAARRTFERYGSWTTPHAAVNEAGLRYLVGFAAEEAAKHGLAVRPWFSLYSSHGPVFRAMLRLERLREAPDGEVALADNVGLYAHCNHCPDGSALPLSADPGVWRCPSCGASSYRLAGPLWTGPLHCSDALDRMRTEATALGWDEAAELLDTLVEESDDALPPYYYTTRDISKAAGVSPPPLGDLMATLGQSGARVARTHIDARAVKTDAPFSAAVVT